MRILKIIKLGSPLLTVTKTAESKLFSRFQILTNSADLSFARRFSSIHDLNNKKTEHQTTATKTTTTSSSSSATITTPKVTDLNTIMQSKIDVAKLDKLEGWGALWSENFAPWHKDDVNPKLATHLSTVLEASEKRNPESVRFFVPLCGKSVDLKFLYDRGFQVIGCEGVEKACQEFFEDNKLEFKRSEEHSGFTVFETLDGRLKIVCGDYFGLTADILGGSVDCVWDRGSFVAIDVTQREKYAQTMSSLLSETFGYLLVSIERQFEQPNMMPHSVSFDDAIKFFDQFCIVKVLEQSTDPGTGESGYTKDNAFLLSRRQVFESEEERLNYWQARWAKGDAVWHHDKPNEFLVKHLNALKADREHVRIFLPLCGKSVDLFWLYNQGHTVVGLEGIPFVAEQVFQEAKLEYSKFYLPEIEGFVFKTPDTRLTIYACDFFKMKPEIIGKFEAIFDRGSFEAIDEKDREPYSDFIFKILAPKFRIILNGYEYNSDIFKGPPRNVNREEVYKLFGRQNPEGPSSTVSIAEEADYTEHGRTKFNLDSMIKFLYLIQNKE